MSTSGYATIWCILLQKLQPRDILTPITRSIPNDAHKHTLESLTKGQKSYDFKFGKKCRETSSIVTSYVTFSSRDFVFQ